MSEIIFVNKLGKHHFAHLRAVAEGIPVSECAERYLGIDHGNQAKSAHDQTVGAVRAVARRHGESAWRLIGLTIKVVGASGGPTARPSLDEFISERDLDGWSESEVTAMYLEAYPDDPKVSRRGKLRDKQLMLIQHLETLSAEQPQLSDMVTGWFDDLTAKKMIGAGITSLGDLHQQIHTGGVWYRNMPGIGKTKAERIQTHLKILLPEAQAPVKVLFRIHDVGTINPPPEENGRAEHGWDLVHLPEAPRSQAPSPAMISATTDLEAIEEWIKARCGSAPTARSYRREAQRLLLWLQNARQGRGFAQMLADDSKSYQLFLADIPAHWISRTRAKPGEPGWAPFRDQLDKRSQHQALVIVSSLFSWLNKVGYLRNNPWAVINTKAGDDKNRKMLDSKAFSEAAINEFIDYLHKQPPSPSRDRMIFIVRFTEAVGLRSAELLGAKLSDFQLEPEGWILQVHGKGSKNRLATVPKQAYLALQEYLQSRGQASIQTAPPEAPLIASTLDPMDGIGYQALYEHVKSWVKRFISASELPAKERNRLANASTHWLRHTFGTRAIERGVPTDVIQAQMGHESIKTTTSIYGRAPLQRRATEIDKAFSGS